MMKRQLHRWMFAVALLLGAPASRAEDAKPAASAPPVAAMSQSKFVGLLYSEIARRTPRDKLPGPGTVSASFRVNGKGRIDKVDIIKATSPAHAEIVKKTLAQVEAPPPPGGVFEAAQNFTFH
jgi:protein TonB